MGPGQTASVVIFDSHAPQDQLTAGAPTQQACAARSGRICAELARRGIPAEWHDLNTPGAPDCIPQSSIALFCLDDAVEAPVLERVRALTDTADAAHALTLLWGSRPAATAGNGWTEIHDPAVSPEEMIGRLATLATYAPLVRQLDGEVQHLQRLGQQLNRYFEEIDYELRLAGRLQREFLPQQLPEMPSIRFSHLYRPAGWVSGDVYDVIRIDDRYTGIFIADAMGHGTASGLMTLLLMRSVAPQRQEQDQQVLQAPPDVLYGIHEHLVSQKRPNTQFVTAVYGILDRETTTLRLARGGHPYPIRIRPDGRMEELRTEGGLIGLYDLPPDFDEYSLQLQPGDKLVLYTDGLEEVLIRERDEASGQVWFTPELQRWASIPAERFAECVGEFLDLREGSLHPGDDITLLVLGVQE